MKISFLNPTFSKEEVAPSFVKGSRGKFENPKRSVHTAHIFLVRESHVDLIHSRIKACLDIGVLDDSDHNNHFH